MAEPFSVAASCFAVVGLADVVSRAGKEFYQFLNAFEDAPTDAARLRDCIHDIILLVEESKRYWEGLKDHVSSVPSSESATSLRQALPQFKSSLRSLDREMSSLVTVARRYDGITKSWVRVRWVLDWRKIDKSLQRLESSKSTLVGALLLVGR
jgi:hypothetical protein